MTNSIMKKKEKIEFEESSGNVFADLGLKDADSLLMRAELGSQILKILKGRGLKKQIEVQEVWKLDRQKSRNWWMPGIIGFQKPG